MEKEIYEQPEAVSKTIDGRIGGEDVLDNIFGLGSTELFSKVRRIQIVACGTSLACRKSCCKLVFINSRTPMPN